MSRPRWDGFVYVVYLGFDGLYKIGKSRNFHQRLKSLQASNPKAKTITCRWVADRHDCEKYLHRYFAEKQYQREIFRLNSKDILFIKDYLKENTPSVLKEKREKEKPYYKYKRYNKKPTKIPPVFVSSHIIRKHRDALRDFNSTDLVSVRRKAK